MEKQKFIVIQHSSATEFNGYTRDFNNIQDALVYYTEETAKGNVVTLALVINIEMQTTIKVDANLDGIKTEYLI